MQSFSQIAKDLRAEGVRFAQKKLVSALQATPPVAQNGRYKFYSDEDVLRITNKIKAECTRSSPTKDVPSNQLDRIEKMLSEICKQLGVAV